jgi:hypothetical protein
VEIYTIGQLLLIKLLGLCYFFAFASILYQLKGIWGREGITSIASFISQVKPGLGSYGFLKLPTLFYFSSTDRSLLAVAWMGLLFSSFVIAGIFVPFSLLVLWIGYLSFLKADQRFLHFQWDILLLEVGFATIFYSLTSPPLIAWQIYYCFFLFRFIFSSGIVKLRSGCPEWRGFTAMCLHYETQPLPARLAWYAHKQPRWMLKFSTIMVLIMEIVFPFFLFVPGIISTIAVFVQMLLQFLIISTGSFAFFNLLTLALCMPLLNNETLSWFIQVAPLEETTYPLVIWLSSLIAIFLLFLNVLQTINLFIPLPRRLYRLLMNVSFYGISSSYGLFAMMTTIRDELIIEGSNDLKTWKAYHFKWKPGDLKAAPKYVAPHQPRLDWQMWFASLGSIQNNQWLLKVLERLMQGSKPVLDLLAENPFQEAPPKYMRVQRYRYHFTTMQERKKSGNWWKREYIGPYTQEITLNEHSS